MGTDDGQSEDVLPGEGPMLLTENGQDQDASSNGQEGQPGD